MLRFATSIIILLVLCVTLTFPASTRAAAGDTHRVTYAASGDNKSVTVLYNDAVGYMAQGMWEHYHYGKNKRANFSWCKPTGSYEYEDWSNTVYAHGQCAEYTYATHHHVVFGSEDGLSNTSKHIAVASARNNAMNMCEGSNRDMVFVDGYTWWDFDRGVSLAQILFRCT